MQLLRILFLFLICINCTSNIYATATRLNSLGLRDDVGNNFDWMIQKDLEYVHYNPAYVSQMSDSMYFYSDPSDANTGSGGLVYNPFSIMSVMITTGNKVDAEYYEDSDRAALTKDQFNFKSSFRIGRSALGFGLSYASTMDRDTENDYITNRSYFGLTLGYLFKISSRIDFDTSFSLGIPDVEEHDTYDEQDTLIYDNNGSLGFNFLFRFNWEIAKRHRLHALLSYENLAHNAKALKADIRENLVSDGDVVEYTYDRHLFNFGISDELTVSKSTIAHIGIVFTGDWNNASTTTESTLDGIKKGPVDYDQTSVTLVMGLESSLLSFLVVRFGANRRIYNRVNNDNFLDDTEYTTLSEAKTNLYSGFSLRIGNLHLDWVVNNEIFNTGPYAVSGSSVTWSRSDVNTSFAMVYYFDTVDSSDKNSSKKIRRKWRR